MSVLIIQAKGLSAPMRHLVKDISNMIPHSKTDSKISRSDSLANIIELSELHDCKYCLFFECKKHQLFMWLVQPPDGFLLKFLVENIYTMKQLNMTGNCFKKTLPLLYFDESFGKGKIAPLKKLFKDVFSPPVKKHKKLKMIQQHDHTFNFYWADDKIWFRNYQIAPDSPHIKNPDIELVEIGPRFVLTLLRTMSIVPPTAQTSNSDSSTSTGSKRHKLAESTTEELFSADDEEEEE